MEEIGKRSTAHISVLDVLRTGDWEVAEENLRLTRRLTADIFWNVADGNVDRISRLIAKNRELCLVRGNNDRNDGCAGLDGLESSLE